MHWTKQACVRDRPRFPSSSGSTRTGSAATSPTSRRSPSSLPPSACGRCSARSRRRAICPRVNCSRFSSGGYGPARPSSAPTGSSSRSRSSRHCTGDARPRSSSSGGSQTAPISPGPAATAWASWSTHGTGTTLRRPPPTSRHSKARSCTFTLRMLLLSRRRQSATTSAFFRGRASSITQLSWARCRASGTAA